VLGIVNLQFTLPCGQLYSNKKLKDLCCWQSERIDSGPRSKAGRVELSGSATPVV
jgi:hypothetical protein